jgi:hypothetical protein
MVTGAHDQHRSPLTFDGLRPHFLDDIYSLDISWRDRNGTERTRHKEPASNEFMASLMIGDKVPSCRCQSRSWMKREPRRPLRRTRPHALNT